MKKEFLLILNIFWGISCEPAQDYKGEIIPDQKYIAALLTTEKAQNQKAILYLNQLIEDGSSSHLYYLRAKYLFESRQYKKANEDIQHSLKTSPSDVGYLLLAGQIAYDLENYNTALNYFNLIKSNENKQTSLIFLLADISIKLNKYSLANYYLNQISVNDLSTKDQLYYSVLHDLYLTSQTPNLNFWNSFDQNSLHDVRLQRLYLENASEHTSKYLYQNQLLRLMNDYPSDPHLIRFWARFLSQINQFKMAELTYQKAANLFEHNNNNLFLEIGKFYMHHRKYLSALLYLNKIKPDLESFTDIPFLKSKCYLYLGNKIRYKSTMDSVQILFKNDVKFHQFKIKYFGISMDSNLVVKDSLLTIRP